MKKQLKSQMVSLKDGKNLSLRFIFTLILFSLLTAAAMVGSQGSANSWIFDHGLHVAGIGLECTDCHEGVDTAGLGQRLIPGHDVCINCHDQVSEEANCGMCHIDPDNPVAVPPIVWRYEGFEHRRHLTTYLACEACHGNTSDENPHTVLPEMTDCQSCHLEQGSTLECAVCHLGESPRPTDHVIADWGIMHGLEASFGTSNCNSCHAQESCDDCHQGNSIFGAKGSPHQPTWLFNHFAEADFGGECLVCHEVRSYCTDCHRVMIRAPHPFGYAYANPTDGGDHKADYEAFPESCLSCHDLGDVDPTCVRCHN